MALQQLRKDLDVIVYITIGNSDDKLGQLGWHQFADETDRAVTRVARYEGVRVHGRWYSLPNEPWQNACWCLEFADDPEMRAVANSLRITLGGLARTYQQDSIAWAVAETEFIGPRPLGGEHA